MTITHNADELRFEADTGHGVALAEYQRDGDTVVFTHTVVPGAARGQGVGAALVAEALAWARAEGLAVVPQCPFVAAYAQKHPEAV